MSHYWLVLLTIGISAGCLFAAADDVHTFELKWQADGFFQHLGSDLDRTQPFDTEPDFGQREVLRGVVDCSSLDKTAPSVGFIWDKSEGKLYVDLNRDGDLTNDPNGVLETDDARGGDYQQQDFQPFPLSFSTDSATYRYQLTANLYDYPWHKNADFAIRSGYVGDVELYGQKWRFRVVDKLRGDIRQGDSFSVWPMDNGDNKIDSLPAPKNIFLHDRCYAMNFEFEADDDGTPRLECRLTEKDVPLATLRMEGKSINRLVFGDGDMLVLPRLSVGKVTVPVGNFRCQHLSLKPCGEHQQSASPQRINEISILVVAETDNVLKAGAPLNHQVKIHRSGKVLKFDYELVGIGGEKYDMRQISGHDSDNKPSVAIYKGDMQLATGEFEYG